MPERVGDWVLETVFAQIQTADGAISSYQAKEIKGKWFVNFSGSGIVGKTANGFTVVGRDKDGNEYVLGKGDFYVLDSDGIVEPGEQKWTMKLV